MFHKMSTGMQNVYGWMAMLTMALGFFVFLMFCAAFIIGGEVGAALASAAGTLMNWGIRLAACAILIGLVCIYFNKEHTLSMKAENRSPSPPVD
ncbi:hypothetical protein [Novibacillus thermophilus]|jgi:hypothetical protein|uniref:Uncharacterized protein n=1 Tax=Novibacillus thermophilus TaxID=1471761 RepID=A0A1U9K4I7_9BACL|nr:hypothetical protein [Novibacillus thermophilus]AQS54930.1 hypothetical protein B0W44_03220 [Novibacillus thermophilus]